MLEEPCRDDEATRWAATASRTQSPTFRVLEDDDDPDVSAGPEGQATSEIQAYHLERFMSKESKTHARQDQAVAELGESEGASTDPAPTPATTTEEDVPVGLAGWLDLVGAILVNSICYGVTQSFGVFEEYYTTELLKDNSSSQVAWIGSIQYALCPMLGCISGPLFDYGLLRPLMITGGGVYVFSLMMASLATEYYQLLLAQGIGVGVGMGIIFGPAIGTLSHHFAHSKWRSLAYGATASGSAIAGIFFPALLNHCLPKYGFGWTMRILGFFILGIVIVCVFCLSTTKPPRNKIALLSPSVLRNYGYTLFIFGAGFVSLTIYIPLHFAVSFATSRGVPLTQANYAPAVSNGVSVIGRLVPLWAAQYLGPLNVIGTFALLSALIMFFWTTCHGTAGILIYDAFYGIASGGYMASINPSAASFAPEINHAGLYLGSCFFVTGIFWLVGIPITAAIIDSTGSYLPAAMWGGATMALGGAVIFAGRCLRARVVGTPWV